MDVIPPQGWKNLWITFNRSRFSRHLLTFVIATSAGLLFVASSVTAAGTNLRTGGVEDLRGLVIDRANQVKVLARQVDGLQNEVDGLTANYVSPSLTAQINAMEVQTGQRPVTGSGLVVTLDDAPHSEGIPLPTGVSPDDLVVHQQDVQAVVNAMWRGGATAVQVMDQRMISTSAIRCVGNTLLLQGRVYSPPFVVKAIGNVADLESALYNEPGVVLYRQYVKDLNLGWNVKVRTGMYIPAWQGSLNQ